MEAAATSSRRSSNHDQQPAASMLHQLIASMVISMEDQGVVTQESGKVGDGGAVSWCRADVVLRDSKPTRAFQISM
jgi:hypothetical protein